MVRLIRICIRGRDGRIGILLLLVILILGFCGIAISLRMIAWSATFYDVLQQLSGKEILKQIGAFAVLTTISAAFYLVGKYLQQVVQIKWRTALTKEMLSQWLQHQTHWKLKIADKNIDNTDQRIAQDCHIFAQHFITEGLGFINQIVAVVSYFSVLWSLSTFALTVSLFGTNGVSFGLHQRKQIQADFTG